MTADDGTDVRMVWAYASCPTLIASWAFWQIVRTSGEAVAAGAPGLGRDAEDGVGDGAAWAEV
jgi:hypothetical protein